MNSLDSLKNFLDKKVDQYNSHQFIETDPIQIPHRFSKKEDIEISAFLSATIAWGQRKNIIKSALQLMDQMDSAPYEYILNTKSFQEIANFKYRTFQPIDLLFFLKSLKNIYENHSGLEGVFREGFNKQQTIGSALEYFRKIFFELPHERRTEKHVSNILENASCKRLNLFLRWMVRSDECGVDFGLWKNIPASALMLPLDLHSGNIARKYGILKRSQNDWKAVEEVTAVLRNFDVKDPVKYDFALFGIGAFEKME